MKTKVLILTIIAAVFCCGARFQPPPNGMPPWMLPTEETIVTGAGDQPTPGLPADGEPTRLDVTIMPADGDPASEESTTLSVDGDQTPEETPAQPAEGEVTPLDVPTLPAEGDPASEAVPTLPAEGEPTPADAPTLPGNGEPTPADDRPPSGQRDDHAKPGNDTDQTVPAASPEMPFLTDTPASGPEPGKKGGGSAVVFLVLICAVAVAVGGFSAYRLYQSKKTGGKNRPYQMKNFATEILITRTGPYICSGYRGQGKRNYQEDAFWYETEIGPDRATCVMIADGMGGMDNGAESSRIAAGMFGEVVPGIQTDKGISSKLWNLCRSINSEIYTVNSRKGMNGGTTLVSVYLINNRLYWISIGDSRIYLLRNGVLSAINEEHELENRLYGELLEGNIDLDEVRSTPVRELRKLTSNLGRAEIPLIDQNYAPYQLKSGDKLLLCSDGVSGTLNEEEIIQCLNSPDPEVSCSRIRDLIELKNKPHQDNHSAIVIYITTEDGK